jgi:hypothetical protein
VAEPRRLLFSVVSGAYAAAVGFRAIRRVVLSVA